MRTVTFEEAQRDLRGLLDEIQRDGGVVISEDGRPLAHVLPPPLSDATPRQRRFGHLRGRMSVPDDFDDMGQEEIEAMFYGGM